MANTEIQQLISSFATQLEALAKRAALEQVIATLGGQSSGGMRRGPGRPKGSTIAAPAVSGAPAAARPAIKAVRKGKRRSQEDVAAMGQTLTDYIKANPGQRADQIATALRTEPSTMRLPMLALLASKKVKTQGVRRGTKYYVAGAVPAKK
ncbi:MAG: hypothetical protein SGI72_11575 [Planctomycetota bacterium]|nr:hypothetical protein [Planctomycetota bacterium]